MSDTQQYQKTKPKAPKKTTGADTKKPASKDDIEKNIMGDKPKLDPKVEKRAKDNYNDAINNIKNPQMAGGIEPYYVDMAADNLEKLGNPDAKVFKDLGKCEMSKLAQVASHESKLLAFLFTI